MTLLQLDFSSGPNPQLLSSLFEHPLIQQKITSLRGKSEGAYSKKQSFQWTPAVRALCILVLRTKINSVAKFSAGNPTLQAYARGPISALDYAIGRHAAWISDMFGVDRLGNSIAQRIFKRSNPERKRPGPVAISLNQNFLPIENIQISIGQKFLVNKDEFDVLLQGLLDQGDWELGVIYRTCSERCENTLFNLQPAYLQEVRRMLRVTDIFSIRMLREGLNEIRTIPALSTIEAEILLSFETIDQKIVGSNRLGLQLRHQDISQLFPEDAPLRFGVTPSQAGTLMLLRYLRDIRGLPIHIDYSFAHTSDVASCISAGHNKDFLNCCVMTTASYAMLDRRARREYRPLMVMPAATHSLMGPKSDLPHETLSQSANYLLLSDFPTTPLFWFENLKKAGVVSPKGARITHLDPDDTLSALRTNDRDLRAILWFPYNVIAENVSDAVPLLHAPSQGAGLCYIQNLLFVHSSIFSDIRRAQLLDMMIRDAWLTLMSDEKLCSELIHSQLEEADYKKSLWRYSGLYRVEGELAA